jgi:hypothetical protein
MSDIAALVHDTEKLCRAVATRELEGHPLYIVPQSQIAHEWGKAAAILGVTNPWLDMCLQHLIPDYRGRGPAMIVNDLFLEPVDLKYVFAAVALHELAHVLERTEPFSDLPPCAAIGNAADLVARASEITSLAINTKELVELPIVNVHGIEFMRIAIHLCYRSTRYGHKVTPAAVASRYDGRSGPWLYEIALGDEPERRANDAFSDIKASAPPPEFTALWEKDRRAIERRRKAMQAAA